jgi:hypothetical protein
MASVRKNLEIKSLEREDKEHRLTYSMPPNRVLTYVFDYAKHKGVDGDYQIVLFEFQDAINSMVTSEQTKEKKNMGIILRDQDRVFSQLVPEGSSFELAVGRSNNKMIDGLQRQHTAFRGFFEKTNLFYNQLGMIYYHSLGYHLNAYGMQVSAKYHQDLFLKDLSGNKVLQRLWLNSDSEKQQFLPEKTMVAHSSELNSEQRATLAENIINLFGVGKDIFIKVEGTLGSGNLHLNIKDKASVIDALAGFYDKVDPNICFTIEDASPVGISQEKKRVDTYRAICFLSLDAEKKPTFKAMNLWHTSSNDPSTLDSHQHDRTDYFFEGHSFVGSEKVEIKKEKRDKHLSLDQSKPKLFSKFKKLCEDSVEIDFKDVLSKASIYDAKVDISKSSSRVFYSSEKARAAALSAVKNVFSKVKKMEDEQREFYGDVEKIKEQAKKLQPRNWELIARAATMLLSNEQAKKIGEMKDEKEAAIALKKIEDQIDILTGASAKKAEQLANDLINPRKWYDIFGLWSGKESKPASAPVLPPPAVKQRKPGDV